MTDNPCVICGELYDNLFFWVRKRGVLVEVREVGGPKTQAYEDHKRICNVWRVWIGGR